MVEGKTSKNKRQNKSETEKVLSKKLKQQSSIVNFFTSKAPDKKCPIENDSSQKQSTSTSTQNSETPNDSTSKHVKTEKQDSSFNSTLIEHEKPTISQQHNHSKTEFVAVKEESFDSDQNQELDPIAKPMSPKQEYLPTDLWEDNQESESLEEPLFFTTSMYTDEFNDMIVTVLENETHLLSQEEIQLLDTYGCLSEDSKHLIVRLLIRKQGWIRKSKLDYSQNVRDLDKAIKELQENKMLCTSLTNIDDALVILSKDELKEVLRERRITIENARKFDYIKKVKEFISPSKNSLAAHCSNSSAEDKRIEKLWDSIQNRLGDCIRVDHVLRELFQRLQIIYYRLNVLPDGSPLSNSILAKTSKKNFAVYTLQRSQDIWISRHDLLSYEQALKAEKDFHQVLEGSNQALTKKNKSPEESKLESRQCLIDAWTLCENCIGLWEEYLIEPQERPYYLRRFEAGWIYTRLLSHGTDVLGKLKEYELEVLILQKLLGQNLYRQGKRGKWYERLALVQSKHLNKDHSRVQNKIALQTCLDAIRDPKVHQIYLYEIHKRIRQLEKDLCIPKREQHDFSYMNLKKRKEITIYGERLSEEVIGKKSIWRSDNGSKCSVEQVAIEYYKKQNYRGLHCENGIVKMIVVLLFWDIIFAPIPGVFETPYQSEPLDLRTDSFYESRLDIINERLREIDNGHFLKIIEKVDRRERPRNTRCMGVNWNYEPQDIIEIADCIGASSLSSLCKLYFEEFGQRQGGMPDLCLWNYDKKECLFSEVKGPNDKLSKTQIEWIETLTNIGIPVEVCHVKVWKGEDIFL